MARKKGHSHPSPNGATPATAVETPAKGKEEASPRSASSPDTSLGNLKALNELLLKQTADLRRLVDDSAPLTTVERDVSRLVVSSGLEENRAADLEWAASVMGSLDAERLAAAEMKRGMALKALKRAEIESSLERASSERDSALADLAEMKLEFELQESAATAEATRLRQLLEQKRGELSHLEGERAFLEETLKNAEGDLRVANGLLALIEGEKQELKNSLDRVLSEKDKIQEDAAAMKMTLRETEDKLSILGAAVGDLRKQQEATALALEGASAELSEKTIHFEERIQELETKKANLEEQKAAQNFACELLEEEIAKLKLVPAEKESVESELEATRASLKRANSELDYVSKQMEATRKVLVQVISERDAYQSQLNQKKVENEATNEELERLQLELRCLYNEKVLLLFDLEMLKAVFADGFEAWEDDLKSREQERASAADLKGKQEMEISEMGRQVLRLLSNESKLREQHKESTELNIRLQAAVESAQRDLQLHAEEANGLKLQIEELTKNYEDTAREIKLVKAQLNDHAVDSDRKETMISSMEAEKSELERELADAKLSLSETVEQARTAELNLDKARSLMRSTSEFARLLEEGERQVVPVGAAEDQELDADVQEFAKDLKTIKSAFESGAAEKADMSRELNMLQEAAVQAQNNRSRMWGWLCNAASTIVVVASLTYVHNHRGSINLFCARSP